MDNVAETKTRQAMLPTVLARFPIQRIILVADRGLLSLENIGELTSLADQGGRTLEFILAVPARRYVDLVETFQGLIFDETGLAEATFAGHRLIVAHDPLRAAEQCDRRRARIAELEAMADLTDASEHDVLAYRAFLASNGPSCIPRTQSSVGRLTEGSGLPQVAHGCVGEGPNGSYADFRRSLRGLGVPSRSQHHRRGGRKAD